jgi:hypothetical protein
MGKGKNCEAEILVLPTEEQPISGCVENEKHIEKGFRFF